MVFTHRWPFEQWSSNNTEIERLERFSAAHDFHQAELTRAECDDKAKAVQDELAALQAESEESLQVVATHDAQIAELTRSKEQEMGSEFKDMEHQVTEKSKKMVRLAVMYRFRCYGRGSVRWTWFLIMFARAHAGQAHFCVAKQEGGLREGGSGLRWNA